MLQQLNQIRVAIVDDHFGLREATRLVLSKKHNVILMAENGQDLINQLELKDVDVVILDIQMPILDGEETLKYLKIHYPKLKVIMFSTHSDNFIIEKFKKLGADAYVRKDNSNELNITVQTVFERDSFL